MMSLVSRRELVNEVSPRYRLASKAEKGRILDELTACAGYDRKHAIRLLKNPPQARRAKRARRRRVIYTEPVRRDLARLWPLSGHLGSRRLVAALGHLMEALERHGEWVPEEPIRAKLTSMSASTCERMLKEIRLQRKPRGLCLTRPGTLKRQIAVRRGTDWSDARAGFMEADLVAHSGSACEGEFFHTLTMTDVSSGWTELSPLRGKGQAETVARIRGVRDRLPFPMLGIDSDNGSEFINHHLARFCSEHGIVFTRSRPYAKNDGCRVEQKNWAVVRRHAGYSRLHTEEHFKALSELHGILRLLVNFFEPSARLIRKEKRGQGVRKVHDSPKTPYHRLLDDERISPEAKASLTEMCMGLNPAALRRRLQVVKRALLGDDLVSFLDEASN